MYLDFVWDICVRSVVIVANCEVHFHLENQGSCCKFPTMIQAGNLNIVQIGGGRVKGKVIRNRSQVITCTQN